MRTSSIRGRKSEFQKLKLAFECRGLILQAADFTFYEVRFCKLAARARFFVERDFELAVQRDFGELNFTS